VVSFALLQFVRIGGIDFWSEIAPCQFRRRYRLNLLRK